MATFSELVEFAADDTVDNTKLLTHQSRPLEQTLRGLEAARKHRDLQQILVHLFNVHKISTDELLSGTLPPTGSNRAFTSRTFDNIQAIIMHPDYKPPKGYP